MTWNLKELTPERWNRYSMEQRLHMIESEFSRAAALLRESGDRVAARDCYLRAKELSIWTLKVLIQTNRGHGVTHFFEKLVDEAINLPDFDWWPLQSLIVHAEDVQKHLFETWNDEGKLASLSSLNR